MKLELIDVQQRVNRLDDDRAKRVARMKEWEKMYCLDAGFTETWKDAVTKEGREQVITPDPYNIVGLAMRLIPSQPKIDVPPRDNTDPASQDASQLERWLTAMYQRVNEQQGSNFVDELKLLLFKRGLAYMQALWIQDDLPEKLQKKRFPILIRTLDPLEVGFYRGPRFVEYAYHKYEAEKIMVRQEYPDLTKWEKPQSKGKNQIDTENDMVTVVDFWYTDPKTGDVWHCIMVDDEFAKEPVKTDYPFIPILEVKGEGDGYSILHAINGLWQYQCRLHSNIGTGVLWATWPFFAVSNEDGQVVDDITVRPLATVAVPPRTKFDQIHPDVNLSVLNEMLSKVEAKISQATFPGVLYGDAGNMQAGYGVNILSQAASGRVKSANESLEMGLMWLNELVLALVEAFDDDNKGVELWGKDAASEKLYRSCLYKKQIKGYYENAVQLKLNLPTDDMAKQTFGLRLTEGQNPVISHQTFQDKYLGITVPTDEQERINSEKAKQHPAIQEKLAALAFMKEYPETWEAILVGTPLYDVAMKMADFALGKKPIEPPAPPPMPALPPPPPPGMMPPPSMQPPAMITGPMGGGIPPVMQGQLSPNNLGLPHQGEPGLFGQMVGNSLTPTEELQNLGGQ